MIRNGITPWAFHEVYAASPVQRAEGHWSATISTMTYQLSLMKQPVLQVALDITELDRAVQIAREAVDLS